MLHPVTQHKEEYRQAVREGIESHMQRVIVDKGEHQEREEYRVGVDRPQRITHRKGEEDDIAAQEDFLNEADGYENHQTRQDEVAEPSGFKILVETVVFSKNGSIIEEDIGVFDVGGSVLGREVLERPEGDQVGQNEDEEEQVLTMVHPGVDTIPELHFVTIGA